MYGIVPKNQGPPAATPQISRNALRLIAKAGFRDAAAEKLSQTDQGFARRKKAQNARVKALTTKRRFSRKAAKITKKKVKKEPPMNGENADGQNTAEWRCASSQVLSRARGEPEIGFASITTFEHLVSPDRRSSAFIGGFILLRVLRDFPVRRSFSEGGCGETNPLSP